MAAYLGVIFSELVHLLAQELAMISSQTIRDADLIVSILAQLVLLIHPNLAPVTSCVSQSVTVNMWSCLDARYDMSTARTGNVDTRTFILLEWSGSERVLCRNIRLWKLEVFSTATSLRARERSGSEMCRDGDDRDD